MCVICILFSVSVSFIAASNFKYKEAAECGYQQGYEIGTMAAQNNQSIVDGLGVVVHVIAIAIHRAGKDLNSGLLNGKTGIHVIMESDLIGIIVIVGRSGGQVCDQQEGNGVADVVVSGILPILGVGCEISGNDGDRIVGILDLLLGGGRLALIGNDQLVISQLDQQVGNCVIIGFFAGGAVSGHDQIITCVQTGDLGSRGVKSAAGPSGQVACNDLSDLIHDGAAIGDLLTQDSCDTLSGGAACKNLFLGSGGIAVHVEACGLQSCQQSCGINAGAPFDVNQFVVADRTAEDLVSGVGMALRGSLPCLTVFLTY